jgi:hypothetical protein
VCAFSVESSHLLLLGIQYETKVRSVSSQLWQKCDPSSVRSILGLSRSLSLPLSLSSSSQIRSFVSSQLQYDWSKDDQRNPKSLQGLLQFQFQGLSHTDPCVNIISTPFSMLSTHLYLSFSSILFVPTYPLHLKCMPPLSLISFVFFSCLCL